MADKKSRYVFSDFRGGRNAMDPPWAIGDTQVADAINVEWYQTRLGRKRNGIEQVAGVTGLGNLTNLYRHVPGIDEGAAELWAVDAGTPRLFGRMAAATNFTIVTLKDAFTGVAPWTDIEFASISAKLIVAGLTAQNRLHLWDGTTVRRAGLIAPAAPTVADSAVGGAYAAILRYYRVRWTEQVGGITIRRSEPGPSQSFTPNGGFTAAIVTRPAAATETETHWEVEVSLDNVTFYRIATVILATTTYSDSAATTTYNLSPLSQLTGTYTLQQSYRFIAADQNRLIGFGSFTSTDKQSRLVYSAVLGSLDVSDIERVDTTVGWYADLDEMDSGIPTGLAGPIYGTFFAFKERQVWQGTPTGNVDKPYDWKALSKTIGAISQQSIVKGEDAHGNPALYWMSKRGPYRWSVLNGLEYIGYGIEDLILGPTDTIALAVRSIGPTAHALFYPDKRQVWWWITTAASVVLGGGPPEGYIVATYDTASGGWARMSVVTDAFMVCSTMFAKTLGAVMSQDFKPYMGQPSVTPTLNLYRGDTGISLARAYVVTKAIEPGGPGRFGEVGDAVLLTGTTTFTVPQVTLTVTTIGDFSAANVTASGVTGLLTKIASETQIQQRVVGSGLGQVQFVQYEIGDSSGGGTRASEFNLGRMVVPIGPHDPVGE